MPVSDVSAFKHVVVPVGVVTGLGVGYIVTSIARYMNRRRDVRFCFSHFAWTAICLFLFVGIWWTLWQFRQVRIDRWTISALLLLLIGPASLYLATTLLLPAPRSGEVLDLSRRFDEIGRPFFLCMVIAVVWFATCEMALLDQALLVDHRTGQLAVAVLLSIGAAFPSRRMARFLSAVILILVIIAFVTFRAGLE